MVKRTDVERSKASRADTRNEEERVNQHNRRERRRRVRTGHWRTNQTVHVVVTQDGEKCQGGHLSQTAA